MGELYYQTLLSKDDKRRLNRWNFVKLRIIFIRCITKIKIKTAGEIPDRYINRNYIIDACLPIHRIKAPYVVTIVGE